jgi:hypothetical protein
MYKKVNDFEHFNTMKVVYSIANQFNILNGTKLVQI